MFEKYKLPCTVISDSFCSSLYIHEDTIDYKSVQRTNSIFGKSVLGPDYMSRAGLVSRADVSLPGPRYVC